MSLPSWIQDLPGTIMVSDDQGIILFMNEKAIEAHLDDGGKDLLGKNMLDCHPQPARDKLEKLMETQSTNIYTIEKMGIKKLVYQCPWYEAGQYRGFIEQVIEIPFEMPHFIRDIK
jgi:hypothetical protein